MALNDTAQPSVRMGAPAWLSAFYNPKVRSAVFQATMVVALVFIIAWFIDNTIDNLRRTRITSGFDFLWKRAGFAVGDTWIAFTPDSSNWRAFIVGLINTLRIAIVGIVFATILGFVIGIMRLSSNWLVAKVGTVYVETIRNVPLLLWLLFLYKAVLSILPLPRNALELPFGANLSNRGLILPEVGFGEGDAVFGLAGVLTVFALMAFLGFLVVNAVLAVRASIDTAQRALRPAESFPVVNVAGALLLLSVITAIVVAAVYIGSGYAIDFLQWSFAKGIFYFAGALLVIVVVTFALIFAAFVVVRGLGAAPRASAEAYPSFHIAAVILARIGLVVASALLFIVLGRVLAATLLTAAGAGAAAFVVSLPLAVGIAIIVSVVTTRRRQETGQTFPTLRVNAAILIGLPLLVYLVSGTSTTVTVPELRGFNFQGGLQVRPEFLALLVGLTIYTASFIAEIVRAGILAVSHGQTEAALSLGLRRGRVLRLVVIPQALRVIIPPLTSQYLNLTKNSSLAIAVGYPDLFAIFSKSVLNIQGQAIECIAMIMAVYLTLSLLTSAFMNWFNNKMALVER